MKQKIYTQYEGIKTQDLQTMLDAMNRYMRQHSNESPQGRWEMMGDSFVGVVEYTVSAGMVYVGDYRVTAYNYYEGGGENYFTASGAEPVPYYTVATNEEFDFGTILYIEDIGIVEVQDRGNFQDGIIDLHIGYDTMDSFEDRTRAVYVVHY